VEHAAGRLELQLRGGTVPKVKARHAYEHADACGLMRRLEITP